MPEKVLVCITPQSNSSRLIDKGARLCSETGGELHILHVQRGSALSPAPESAGLLQELFTYGAGLGGVTHGVCGDDIPGVICGFIRREGITRAVFGESPGNTPGIGPLELVKREMAGVEIVMVGKDAEGE